MLKHKLYQLRAKLFKPSQVTKRDMLYNVLNDVVQHPVVKVVLINGPSFYTIKVHNHVSLRTYRIEIDNQPDMPIRVYNLERTHNIIHDIDDFYKGSCAEYEFNNILKDCIDGVYFDDWITEVVDRSDDVDQALCTKMEHACDKPKDDTYVKYAIISRIKMHPPETETQKLTLSFIDIPGDYTVTVNKRDLGLYQIDRLLVVNSEGKHAVFKLSKARKFLKFKSTDWRDINQISNYK